MSDDIRRPGNSRLVYDKARRTIVTDKPDWKDRAEAAEAQCARLEGALRSGVRSSSGSYHIDADVLESALSDTAQQDIHPRELTPWQDALDQAGIDYQEVETQLAFHGYEIRPIDSAQEGDDG